MKRLDDMTRAERYELWLRMAQTARLNRDRRRAEERMAAQLLEIRCLPCTTDGDNRDPGDEQAEEDAA